MLPPMPMHPRLAWQWENAEPPVLNVGCESDPARLSLLDSTVSVDIDLWRGVRNFQQADARKLPFSDKSFNTVVLAECLDHMDNPELAIREAARVAKNRVLITLPADDGGVESPEHYKDHIEHLKALGLTELARGDCKLRHGHFRQWTRHDVEALLAVAGTWPYELSGPEGFTPPEFRIVLKP